MNKHVQSVYLNMIRQELNLCFVAVDKMNAVLSELPNDSSRIPEFFYNAQQLVQHAAACSRFFWPGKSKDKISKLRAERRAQTLCNLLKLNPEHSIKSRVLRDYFEHFDERLDDWAENSVNKHVVWNFIGPKDGITGPEDKDFFHHYDPAQRLYNFQGNSFDLHGLVRGLVDLKMRLDSIDKSQHTQLPFADSSKNHSRE